MTNRFRRYADAALKAGFFVGSLIAFGLLLTAAPTHADYTALNFGPYITAPSQLTLSNATTAYGSNQLIANSSVAGSVVVPSFTNNGGVAIRIRLNINDSTSTAWGNVPINVDWWSAAPTFTNGDRGAFAVATGSTKHIGTFSCTMSAENGDGVYAECAPSVGNAVDMGGYSTIFWTAETMGVSGVTAASKTMTLVVEAIP
jgi:hypothetical protein